MNRKTVPGECIVESISQNITIILTINRIIIIAMTIFGICMKLRLKMGTQSVTTIALFFFAGALVPYESILSTLLS